MSAPRARVISSRSTARHQTAQSTLGTVDRGQAFGLVGAAILRRAGGKGVRGQRLRLTSLSSERPNLRFRREMFGFLDGLPNVGYELRT